MFFRVVSFGPETPSKEIGGHKFENFGSHSNHYPLAYLTAAAAIGISKEDVDLFVKRLDKVLEATRVELAKLTPM